MEHSVSCVDPVVKGPTGTNRAAMSPQARGRAQIDDELRDEVIPLRTMGYSVNQICEQLGLHKASEWAAVQMICEDRSLRKHRKGDPGISGPVKPGPNRSQVKTD